MVLLMIFTGVESNGCALGCEGENGSSSGGRLWVCHRKMEKVTGDA